jgi:serine/threonine-protein kinase HipA
MMTGSEQSLDIILGKDRIAKLSLLDDQLFWHYDEAWQQSGYAVSPHLPVQGDIPSLSIQRYLRNLFPEGNALDELISCFHLSKNNTFGLVRALGLDIPGSLIMLPSGQTLSEKATVRKISDQELTQRLDEREDFSIIIWDGKPRLSVAGVQDKINVILSEEGQLAFGEGALCSTHILKFENKKLHHLALNEHITMQLAKFCGLTVANTELKYFGNYCTLLVERFDRRMISPSHVDRRHIIDGCQALNLAPEYKYERNFGSGRDVAHIRDGASYSKLFNFANQCNNPALTKQKILDWALFNTLISNFDAHGKNISFFVGSKGISLAPFYDLVNVKMYDDFEHEMAMGFGEEFDAEAIHAYQLADFADSCNLPRSLVAKSLKRLILKLQQALSYPMTFRNVAEEKYFKKYQKMVNERCKYFLNHVDEIMSMEL